MRNQQQSIAFPTMQKQQHYEQDSSKKLNKDQMIFLAEPSNRT